MEKHYGEIVESVVREKGFSITELSNQLNINRRTLYNWFNTKILNENHVYEIGSIINHDFSNEFPELLKSVQNKTEHLAKLDYDNNAKTEEYKNKYIDLLERYNNLLQTIADDKSNEP